MCSIVEIGARIKKSAIIANLTMASSKFEKIVLAFSTKSDVDSCSGTLFEVHNEVPDDKDDKKQYYKLRLKDRNTLEFTFRLQQILAEVRLVIDVDSIDFCDSTRHIVNIERSVENSAKNILGNKIKYRIDGRKVIERTYQQAAAPEFIKPYHYYVGDSKEENDEFDGCISGAKFHLFSDFLSNNGFMKTVEPIVVGIRSNDSSRFSSSF